MAGRKVLDIADRVITLSPFVPLKKKDREAVALAAEQYGKFLGKPAVLV